MKVRNAILAQPRTIVLHINTEIKEFEKFQLYLPWSSHLVNMQVMFRKQNALLPPATKLGQGYIFTGVCDSVHRGVCAIPACIAGGVPACLAAGLGGGEWYPSMPCRFPGPHPRGKFRVIRSRPTAKGEVEGDLVQAHTQGEVEGDLSGGVGGWPARGGGWPALGVCGDPP